MNFCVEIGEATFFSKTITDADLLMFSAISGDFDPVYVDEEYAKTTPFGRRIAHRIAVLGLMSAAEWEMSRRIVARGGSGKTVSLGYEGVRFLKPVFVGDTLKAQYTIAELLPEKARAIGRCEIRNQRNETVLVGNHLMKWVS